MDLCRICLTNKTHKKISDLNMDINENTNYSQDVMMFCLGIQVESDPKISTKLCTKCYKKIKLFYEFKVLALKNNAFLKTVSENTFYENDSYNGKDVVKIEEDSLDDANDDSTTDAPKEILVKVKDEFEKEMKEEDSLREFDSDDEVLSVIKIIKNENMSVESTKENAPVKKKRGRPKICAKKEKPTSTLQICDTCGKPVKNLKDHLEIHNANRKTISCKMCDKTFRTKGAKHRHYKIKHLGIKGHCNICGKDVVALKQHTLLAHNREALRFVCSMCDQRFISESSLKAHMITHCKARPYECDICHNNYRSKLGLDQHKRQVHEKEKSHLCQFCSKSFFKKYHLQVHIRSHTHEKPYKCPDCDKSFGTGCMLKNHRLIHSDVKAFACIECGMRFSRPGYLRNHMISHTKEKRYPCRYCAMRFGRSDHRKRHEYTAHEKHSMPSVDT